VRTGTIDLGKVPTSGVTQLSTPQATTLAATMLIQANSDDVQWFRNIEMPIGSTAWELTRAVAKDRLEATYYGAFGSHFVDSLFGMKNKDPYFWLFFQWNGTSKAWEPVMVGADNLTLLDEMVLAWHYTDSSEPSAVPAVKP
jgi:hypothetical protein